MSPRSKLGVVPLSDGAGRRWGSERDGRSMYRRPWPVLSRTKAGRRPPRRNPEFATCASRWAIVPNGALARIRGQKINRAFSPRIRTQNWRDAHRVW